jgi:hypothetical protein
MNVSMGASNFSNGWVTSFAERDFTQTPPPPAPGEPTKPFVPATLRINISDDGYRFEISSAFVAPKDGTTSANVSYFEVNGFPARMTKTVTNAASNTESATDGSTAATLSILLDLLIKNRFLLEIRSTNLTEDQLKKYTQSLSFAGLLSAPDTGATTIDNPVILSRVDELQPSNTRSYPLYWTRAKGR